MESDIVTSRAGRLARFPISTSYNAAKLQILEDFHKGEVWFSRSFLKCGKVLIVIREPLFDGLIDQSRRYPFGFGLHA